MIGTSAGPPEDANELACSGNIPLSARFLFHDFTCIYCELVSAYDGTDIRPELLLSFIGVLATNGDTHIPSGIYL